MGHRYPGWTGVQGSPPCLGSDDFGDGTPPERAERVILTSVRRDQEPAPQKISPKIIPASMKNQR